MEKAVDEEARAALLAEGDRLARVLGQALHGRVEDGARLQLLGRSLAVNLVPAFQPTLEQIARHAGRPLHALLVLDDRGRAALQTVSADGEVRALLPADDLLAALLTEHGRLRPDVRAELQGALSGDEHHATRALVRCLRSRAVLKAMGEQVQALL